MSCHLLFGTIGKHIFREKKYACSILKAFPRFSLKNPKNWPCCVACYWRQGILLRETEFLWKIPLLTYLQIHTYLPRYSYTSTKQYIAFNSVIGYFDKDKYWHKLSYINIFKMLFFYQPPSLYYKRKVLLLLFVCLCLRISPSF